MLITSSGTLECSKVLLASRSTFFNKIFNQSHNVGKFANRVFTDCSFEVLKCAMDVIFGLEVKMPLKLTGQFKFILKKWQIKYIVGEKKVSEESDSGIARAVVSLNRDDEEDISVKQVRVEGVGAPEEIDNNSKVGPPKETVDIQIVQKVVS